MGLLCAKQQTVVLLEASRSLFAEAVWARLKSPPACSGLAISGSNDAHLEANQEQLRHNLRWIRDHRSTNEEAPLQRKERVAASMADRGVVSPLKFKLVSAA